MHSKIDMQNLKYPVGTRYSNSEYYDRATSRIAHGWQVFEQVAPNGNLTGRESFVNNTGSLCGLDIAKIIRQSAIQNSADELVKSLKDLLSQIKGYEECNGSRGFQTEEALKVLQMAIGITEEL
jgi:hypothetical protein